MGGQCFSRLSAHFLETRHKGLYPLVCVREEPLPSVSSGIFSSSPTKSGIIKIPEVIHPGNFFFYR